MALIDEMRNLREDIESGKEIRTRRIKEIKEDLSVFMKDASLKRKEDFKALTEEVNQFITDLKGDVKATRRENRTQQQELKKELSVALAAFWGKKKQAKKAI
ncbi:hypothetical protein KKG36_00490 [Patescibacteria group bacterium]|nr:hypothetical protein [Patescibacteria group bacterium]